MLDCYCDYDMPEFCDVRIVRARKQHQCYECRRPILPGEQYEYTSGKWDGYMDCFKTCEDCRDLRKWVQNNVPCLCWAYGNLHEDLENAIDDACSRAPLETSGIKFGFLRRKVLIRRKARALIEQQG